VSTDPPEPEKSCYHGYWMAYGKFKEELVRFQMNDSTAYSEIKDPVCDLIRVEARKWAEQTEWSPGLAGVLDRTYLASEKNEDVGGFP
jgi:hypothetical protein